MQIEQLEKKIRTNEEQMEHEINPKLLGKKGKIKELKVEIKRQGDDFEKKMAEKDLEIEQLKAQLAAAAQPPNNSLE